MATILLVDDDAGFLTALERLLVQDGHRTRRAADRAAALAQAGADADPIDLVIADLELCDESGLGLLRELRRADPELPLIVLTAAPDASSYLPALRLPALPLAGRGDARNPFRQRPGARPPPGRLPLRLPQEGRAPPPLLPREVRLPGLLGRGRALLFRGRDSLPRQPLGGGAGLPGARAGRRRAPRLGGRKPLSGTARFWRDSLPLSRRNCWRTASRSSLPPAGPSWRKARPASISTW